MNKAADGHGGLLLLPKKASSLLSKLEGSGNSEGCIAAALD